jgi:hypothetical protein
MINLLFSMVGPLLDDSMEAGFRNYAQWTVLGERNGRLLVDAIGNAAMVGGAFNALDYLGRDPIAIGAWTADCAPVDVYPFNLAAFLAVAPPDLIVGDDGEVTEVPLTAWRELHAWGGWAAKQIPET